MKKTLAMLLSFAMVLSFMVGMFAFSASAETDTATAKAEAAWAKATKTTSVTVDGVELKNGETKNLAELNAEIFTGGTIALQDGVLTVTNAAFAEEKVSVVKAVNGGLSVKLMGADWKGAFRTNDAKAINTPLLVTSDGHDIIGGGNALRACSDLILYGDVGAKIDAGAAGYDCAIVDNNAPDTTAAELVLGGTRPFIAASAGNGPTVENRRGSITICGKADVTINNGSEVSTGTPYARALAITAAAVTGNPCISILDDANLTINTSAGGAITNEAMPVEGDSIVIDTTGKVALTASGMYCSGWNAQSSLIYATQGTVRFKKGDIFLNANLKTWKAGANSLVNSNNGGFREESIVIEGTANVVGYHKSSVTGTNYRFASFWTNGGLMVVKGDAELTLYTDNVQAPTGSIGTSEYMAFNAKAGGFHVKDNAKVFINGGGATLDKDSYIRFQAGNYNTVANFEKCAAVVGKSGLQVSGGQLFINFPAACYGVNTNDMNTDYQEGAVNYKSSFSFTGGVVVLKNNNDKKYSLIGSDPTDAAKFGVVSGEVFCSKNDRMGSVWYYFGENAPVSAFDNIDALGLSLTKGDAAPFSADGKTFTAPVEGNFKAEGTDAKLNGTAVTSGNKVVTAKANDKITASADLVVSMTKDAPTEATETPETPEEVKVENPAAEVVITKADGTTVALNKDNKTTEGATYDPATGKLTIEGLNAKKITAASGDVIVEVKGTNSLTNDTAITETKAAEAEKNTAYGAIRVEDGDLYFVGDGSLKVSAKGLNIYVTKGAVTFTDKVNVTVEMTEKTGIKAAGIYLPTTFQSDDAKVTFAGNSTVKGTSVGGPVVCLNMFSYAYGTIEIKDNATVDLTVSDESTNWQSCAFASHWDISGGTLNASMSSTKVVSQSAIAAYADNGSRGTRNSSFKMTGGTVNLTTKVNVENGKARPHGLFTNYANEISITGGTLNLDVTGTNAAVDASGAICVQWNNANDKQADDEFTKVTIGGDAVINAKNCDCDGLFGVSNGNGNTKAAIVIEGGKITGSDNTFVYDRVGKSTLEIKGGEIDWTSKTVNVKGAKATATINFKEGGVKAEDKVIKTGTNPGTSDLSVALISVIAVTSVVTAAAVLFVRKRRYN